jgi:formate dehydrogenase subunit gamma
MAPVAMLVVLLSGIPLWWPTKFGWGLRQLCLVVHDIGFIFWFVAIVGHIYLGTAAEPGTFRSMTRGTVTRAWAKLHHPRWFREVTGDRK